MERHKVIISLKCKDSDIPKIIKDKDSFLTAPKDLGNLFNNLFCSVAPNIQSKINFCSYIF